MPKQIHIPINQFGVRPGYYDIERVKRIIKFLQGILER